MDFFSYNDDHNPYWQRTHAVVSTPQKGNQGAKTQTNQAKPRGEAHEGKATPKGVQVGKTNKPEGN
jgi:hypothetical protein